MTLLRLVLLVEVVMIGFALLYFNLAVNLDGQMVGIHTRLDALYFTATTMTTTGFGDVHAAGQLARGVTTVHLVFDVLFVAILARLASNLIGRP
ncbi:hypothetical protein H9L09_02065 [Nocardioides mesophilus]|uniref:Potassium channel domain-containing protein n=2 Tax=Nocardioides mesophilus TaxID=433659 RepID=A0A7G9RGP6_9ACTN|nr:hypothetical protein H9L09_02065 [Nocardioides mesophilus]